MTAVRFSVRSLSDRARVLNFLERDSPAAADRALEVLSSALHRLSIHPTLGIAGPSGYRRLIVPFGRAGYEIRYRIYPDVIVITRIFHTREKR